jgi:hypothetical protein
MTDHEWDSFVQLYRELWKAYADLATMRIMLVTADFAARTNRPDIAMDAVRDWRTRAEKARGKGFYAKHYLTKGEAHITQAGAERSDKLLLELLSQDPPRELPWRGDTDV